jgi:hypothetical protein
MAAIVTLIMVANIAALRLLTISRKVSVAVPRDLGTLECDSFYEYPHDLDDEATRDDSKRYPTTAFPAVLLRMSMYPCISRRRLIVIGCWKERLALVEGSLSPNLTDAPSSAGFDMV